MSKKLYRSKTDVKLSGVCGGAAAYVGMDSTVVRLLWVLLTLCTGGFPGIVMYIVCVFLIPLEPDTIDVDYREKP